MQKYYILLLAFLLFGCNNRTEFDKNKLNSKSQSQNYIYPQQKYSEEYHKIEKYFNSRFKRGIFNGVVLFAEGEDIVFEKAFGYSDIRKKIPLQIDSEFQIASVTKPITAFAIQLLISKGKLNYTDSVTSIIKGFPYEGVTIHHLLTHRSGLPEYMYFADSLWQDKINLAVNNSDIVDMLIEFAPPKYYLPGRRYNYINTNYALLASIIEIVSGKRYSEYLKDEIFTPLKMNHTEVYKKHYAIINDQDVVGFVRRRRRAENSYLNGVVGDKGIYTTVEDLYKFDRALANGMLIDKSEIEKAFIPYHRELYKHDNYGYGWRINTLPDGTKVVHHTGWWKGFRSYFIRALDQDKTIIVLSNQSEVGVLYSSTLMDLFDIKRY